MDKIDSIASKCEELLRRDPVELYKTAALAAEDIVLRHTQYHRMKFMVNVIRRYRDTGRIKCVDIPFFLPETDVNLEKQFAIRNR